MQIIVTKYGGFCFGVERAVETALNLPKGNNYILGEIIHNEEVIQELEDKGLITVNSLDDVPDGATLLIRTHGVCESIFREANERGLKVVDCTCPFVKEIQVKVSEFYNKGYAIVIIGEESHPEVQGINGWCENQALITENPEDLETIKEDKVCIVVQTTYSKEKFDKIIKGRKNIFIVIQTYTGDIIGEFIKQKVPSPNVYMRDKHSFLFTFPSEELGKFHKYVSKETDETFIVFDRR